MRYQEGQKVTIQSEEWYNTKKQPNGFIIFKDGNKISTFSPGMVKFCNQTFTVGKVITGSSIYPDHYTFVEDGGAYKWTDDMIAGLASADAPTYTREAAPAQAPAAPKPAEQPKPAAPKPAQKPVEQPKPAEQPKPVEQPKPAAPKPVEQPKPAAPKPAAKPAEQPKPAEKPAAAPVEKPEPTPVRPAQPNPPVQQPQHQQQPAEQQPPVAEQQQHRQAAEESAFESFTILLKPKQGASLSDCTVQAYKIMAANEGFPSAAFEFNGFEIAISRK